MNILIIPDGNRRWSRENGVSFDQGYERLAQRLAESFEWLHNHDIPEVWVLVCSTNNLRRPAEEVDSYLQHFLEVQNYTKLPLGFTLTGEGLLKDSQREAYEKLAATQHDRPSLTVHYLIGWSLDNEVVRLVNHFRHAEQPVSREHLIEASDIKKPIDLIIRTGKVSRISEVVPWHSPYAELCFVDAYWPDFTNKHLKEAIDFYQRQERRSGL